MEEDKDKLNKLDGGNVFLPPEILLNAGTKGSTQVVEVHDCVNTYSERFYIGSIVTSYLS